MVDRGTCFQQLALSFGNVEGADVLLPGHGGGRLSILLKVWELHRRDGAGQDALCCLLLRVTLRFPSLFALC